MARRQPRPPGGGHSSWEAARRPPMAGGRAEGREWSFTPAQRHGAGPAPSPAAAGRRAGKRATVRTPSWVRRLGPGEGRGGERVSNLGGGGGLGTQGCSEFQGQQNCQYLPPLPLALCSWAAAGRCYKTLLGQLLGSDMEPGAWAPVLDISIFYPK